MQTVLLILLACGASWTGLVEPFGVDERGPTAVEDCTARDSADPEAVAEALAARETAGGREASSRAYLHFVRGMLAMHMGDPEEAAKELRRALLHDRDSEPVRAALQKARLQLGESLSERGRHRRALAVLRALHGSAGDEPRALIVLAEALLRAGETNEARALLRRVQTGEITDPTLLERLADALEDVGCDEEAAR